MIFYYMRQDRYTTRIIHPVCINLEPQHYEFLRQLAERRFMGNISDTIHYLLSRYLNHLYEIRVTPTKRTETANYQPRTLRYRRWVIPINPVLWSKLFEMRHFVGYSMSALIRIMLDWEMQHEGYDIIPLIVMPTIAPDDPAVNPTPENAEPMLNNYFYVKQGIYEIRQIECSFLDQFY